MLGQGHGRGFLRRLAKMLLAEGTPVVAIAHVGTLFALLCRVESELFGISPMRSVGLMACARLC
jgi:hypothetical protein